MAQPPRRRSGQPGGGRGRPPATPPANDRLSVPNPQGQPVGRDQARARADAPPRRARADTQPAAPPRPPLPDDEQPQLPHTVIRDIERAVGKGPKSRDIALCLSIGSQALEEDRVDVAIEVLAWARHHAPRLVVLREAYGIALYHDGRYADALSELQAYRRMSDHTDQNHVIADCLRALGRDLQQIAAAAEPLLTDTNADEDRRAEAAIVWAAALADTGDINAGRAILRRFLNRPHPTDPTHNLRVHHLAADLATQANDPTDHQHHHHQITTINPNYHPTTTNEPTDSDGHGRGGLSPTV